MTHRSRTRYTNKKWKGGGIKTHVSRIQLKSPDEAAFKIKTLLFTAELHDTIFTSVCTYTSHSLVFRLV